MLRRCFVFLILALPLLVPMGSVIAQGNDNDAETLPAKERFHLFLLVGQSNMAGRGKIEPQDQQHHSRLLMLSKYGTWVPAVDPLHFDKSVAGVGLGRTFGLQLIADDPQITVGLIPCAVGGSPIDSWQPGQFYPPTASHPWDDAMLRARIAQKSGVIKGILWHQGESDSNQDLAAGYQVRLDNLIDRMRSELQIPDTPFIVGQMGQFAERPWDEFRHTVDQAHQTLPMRVPQTAFVSSDGLQHKGDQVHFNSAAYRELGRRYANAYLAITKATAADP